jgi:hypothetical protein
MDDRGAPAVDRSHIRLFRFRPIHPAFDRTLREVMIPDLASCPGIRAIHVGRQGPDEIGERVVASVWASRAAMAAAVGESFEHPRFHPEYMDETTDKRLDIVPLRFAIEPSVPVDERVVRLVFGRTRPGAIVEYADEVEQGTRADIAAGTGPRALYLGVAGDDRFVTVSVWGHWSAIARATGGSVLSPNATRHDELLLEWSVAHYEAVPLEPATDAASVTVERSSLAEAEPA